jgi:acetyl-CoA C-acetyltransferase
MTEATKPAGRPAHAHGSIDPRAPVIVGVGQALSRDVSDEDGTEPVALILEALRRAGEDSGASQRLLAAAESVRCVSVIGWSYPDLAALIARRLGARPRETLHSAAIGGEGPQRLLNDTARAISGGELDVALVGGGEAIATLRAAQSEGRTPRWRPPDQAGRPVRTLEAPRPGVNDAETAAGLAPPMFMYALIESAVRTARNSTPEAHLERIARLWSRFSDVAAGNPHAWLARSHSAGEIATPAPDNRLVAAPYTKLLTANIQVNMASGLILASADAAERAGVAKDRWVFIHAGAQAQDEWHVSERHQLAASPAIRAAGRAVLDHVGIGVDEIAHVDLYSCFPSAVQIAAEELGLSLDDPARPLTVTGGLTFAGGPGNNYSAHAIAALTHRLREDSDAYGLATALGWYLTKHAVGVYSARPPRRAFASLDPTPQPQRARRARTDYAGPATLEAWTVTYRRDGDPDAAVISCLTPDGERALLRTSDRDAVAAILRDDPIGEPITVGDDQRVTLAGA